MHRFARIMVAALVALGLAACAPSAKIDKDNPFSTLVPWNHKWTQIKKTEGGVEYIFLSKGDGKGLRPSPADRVVVQYDARLAATGEAYESNFGSEPQTFRLTQMMPGWQEGLPRMATGDEVMFWIPSDLAFGRRGAPGIPPNSDMMFRIRLVEVKPAVVPDADAWKKVTPWPTDSADVVRTSSGLEYLVIETGKSTEPPPGEHDTAIVNFEGRLEDGDVAISTFEDQQTQSLPLQDVTPGWAEALQMMHPGDKWMIRMPAGLMYGAEGDGRIPPNATIIIELRLESIQRAAAPLSPQ
jgi:FKBP-type peptidyl-prolyl cis-trans isomerase